MKNNTPDSGMVDYREFITDEELVGSEVPQYEAEFETQELLGFYGTDGIAQDDFLFKKRNVPSIDEYNKRIQQETQARNAQNREDEIQHTIKQSWISKLVFGDEQKKLEERQAHAHQQFEDTYGKGKQQRAFPQGSESVYIEEEGRFVVHVPGRGEVEFIDVSPNSQEAYSRMDKHTQQNWRIAYRDGDKEWREQMEKDALKKK